MTAWQWEGKRSVTVVSKPFSLSISLLTVLGLINTSVLGACCKQTFVCIHSLTTRMISLMICTWTLYILIPYFAYFTCAETIQRYCMLYLHCILHTDNCFILWLKCLKCGAISYHWGNWKFDLYHREILWNFFFKCHLNSRMRFTVSLYLLILQMPFDCKTAAMFWRLPLFS